MGASARRTRRNGDAQPRPQGKAGIESACENRVVRDKEKPTIRRLAGDSRDMKRSLGVSIALSVVSGVLAAGAASGGSWDERVFGSHVDFDMVAAAGPSALLALIERGRQLFKAKFTTADGAGRPKATQR